MTRCTQKLSISVFSTAVRNVTLALFLIVFGASATFAQTLAYVTNSNGGTVSVIDTSTNTVTATIPGLSGPFGIAVTPNSARAYVANNGGTDVSVIDTATNTVTATPSPGSFPIGIDITPNGAFVYVVNNSDFTVSVISTATNTVTATVPVGNAPVHIAFAVRTQGPTGKDQCKQGGWQTFTNPAFKNEGDCVSFVNHMQRL